MDEQYQKDLELGRELSEAGQWDKAYILADRYLRDDPNDVRWLVLMTFVMLASAKPTIGYSLARRCTQLAPKDSGMWMNLGMAANDLWLDEEAVRHYTKASKLAKTDSQKAKIWVNLSALLIDTGQFDKAEDATRKALEYNPESTKARANLGFCQLAQRKWADGWKNYRHCLGTDWRPRVQYANEPEWDGKSTGTIVLYAEQGLGDVISFGSMVSDAVLGSPESRFILDVDDRLASLFQRSFPDTTVYGTRGRKELAWDKRDQEIDFSLPMGQLGEYFRTKTEDFPGEPFLVPDPDRVYMWKQLFKSKKKPVIGLAWRGGIPRTGAKYRQWDLEQLLPILKSVDAHWVSLQYKPAAKEIAAFKAKHPEIDIVEYPHGTLTKDYDDTVAMTAALDRVICMQTAIVHVCGGLGIPCWVFVPRNSQWRYGQEGEDFVWAKSVRIVRQTVRGEWDGDIKRIAKELRALYKGRHNGRRKAPSKPRRTTGRATEVLEENRV